MVDTMIKDPDKFSIVTSRGEEDNILVFVEKFDLIIDDVLDKSARTGMKLKFVFLVVEKSLVDLSRVRLVISTA